MTAALLAVARCGAATASCTPVSSRILELVIAGVLFLLGVRSLVHWLRRLVFRSAWLDQRVKEGELDVRFDTDEHTFAYIQPDRDGEPVELAPEPSWGRVAYKR